MTFDVYAIYPEGSYLIASSTDQKHGTDFTETILQKLGIVPMAVATLTRGEHTIRGAIFDFGALINKYGK